MVKVKLLRPWPVGDVTYRPGQILEVPAARADRMAATHPPYAERLTAENVDATDGAREAAAEHGLDLSGYAGQGSGAEGRITMADVEGWAQADG